MLTILRLSFLKGKKNVLKGKKNDKSLPASKNSDQFSALFICLLVCIIIRINDFSSGIYVLQRKTQRLPNLTQVSKWNATLQKITKYEFVCLFLGRIVSLNKNIITFLTH